MGGEDGWREAIESSISATYITNNLPLVASLPAWQTVDPTATVASSS